MRLRMLLRPRWLLTHLLVACVALTFVNLGLWQLRRLEERRADNALIVANMSAPPADLDETLARFGNDPAALTYRRVVVDGEYRAADEVLLTPRSLGRHAGHHVVTPLEVSAGQGVLVNRGWVPFADDEPPIEEAPPPAGEVRVTGILLPTQTAARYGRPDGGAGRLTYLSTVDVDRIQPQIDLPLHPFSILLTEQDPAGGELPAPAPPPEVDEGSHQSYAWQWFSFTAILLAGYPLLLRRSLRGAAAARRQADESVPDPVAPSA